MSDEDSPLPVTSPQDLGNDSDSSLPPIEDTVDQGGDDLFGDDDDDGEEQDDQSRTRRHLDDEELDSGDDEDRRDRDRSESAEVTEKQLRFHMIELARHAIPEPDDNEFYLLKVPNFLAVDPKSFDPEKFQPPVTDHHSKGKPSDNFSAYTTAMTTVRWRPSPSNPEELQSNARILRWSDGSLTFQFAHDPTTQYQIEGNPLAPPQSRPPKPTPLSGPGKNPRAPTAYNPSLDSFTYLFAPYSDESFLRAVRKVTAGLSILPTSASNDAALQELQRTLQRPRDKLVEDGPVPLLKVHEDPELAKKKAEAAEKESLRMQRRLEAQRTRERERTARALGRGGVRSGGLTVGGLEDEDGFGGYRRSKPKARRPRRDDYSTDEEYGGARGHTREDEYDEEDDFIAKSDEEPEIVESDEEEEEELEDDFDEVKRPARREGTPKRADREEDEPAPSGARVKRRRVVEEDDDEE